MENEDKLNRQLLLLYLTSTSLQEATDVEEVFDITVNTFRSLGYDRVRIYFAENLILKGKKCSYIADDDFRKIRLDISYRHSKAFRCFRDKTPIIEKTKKSDRGRLIIGKDIGLESASLPLFVKNRIIGLISLDNRYSEKPLLKEDLNLLMTFSNQIAIAIHNSELYNENEKKIKTMLALYEITSAISLTLELDKIINLIILKIVKLLRVDVCCFLMIDDSRKNLLRTTSYGFPEDMPKEVPMTDPIIAKSAMTLEVEYFPDLSIEEFQEKPLLLDLGIKSMLSVPLKIESSLIGLFNIYSRKRRVFSDEEMNLLNTLSNQAAIAIENSNLYRRIRNDKESLSKLLEISEDINSILNLELLLRRILEKTILFTESDFGDILLVEDSHVNSKIRRSKDNSRLEPLKLNRRSFQEVFVKGSAYIANNPGEMGVSPLNTDIMSKAVLPLKINDQIIGFMNLESKRLNNYKVYRKSLEILTNHIAIAIENAKLYDEIRDFNKKLQREVKIATRELIQKNKELKKLDQLKSDFVSNVSHELRTPLTSISGYSKLLKTGKLGSINPQQMESLSIIIEESDRLSRLINDILNISKLESGKVDSKFEVCDLRSIIEGSIHTLAMDAKEKDIHVSFSRGREIPYISGNEDQLKQLILNLLSNAIKFTGNGGKIDVLLKRVDESIIAEIRDNGIGIPKDKLGKIFNKFYQVDSSITKAHSGTGLGLVIAKKIVEIHSGRIWVESVENKGSSFYFSLPIRSS